jgi:hypothetical protein
VTETTSSAVLPGHSPAITLRTPTMPHRGVHVNTRRSEPQNQEMQSSSAESQWTRQ